MTRNLGLSLSLGLLATLAACSNDGTNNRTQGYLSSDPCASRTDPTSCAAAERGCKWVSTDPDEPVAFPGVPRDGTGTKTSPTDSAPRGACVTNSPCYSLDENACQANSTCAWAGIKSICPIGATCMSTGFCYPKDDSGTDCVCVSPAIACAPNEDCAPVTCDCTGGGSGGSGGSCACACPSCAPGQDCPPCVCNCDDGGPGCTGSSPGSEGSIGTGTGGGTTTNDDAPPPPSGTCDCACAPCQDGTSCPPCVCNCPAQPVEICSTIKDPSKCTADVGCGLVPGPSTGGVVCAPLRSGGGGTGCVPPSPPDKPVPGPVCPAIACATECPNGYAKDQSGCDTCTCAQAR